MPSLLGARNFATGGGTGSGIARAKKAADLYIKTNTDSSGQVSDPAVYDYVNNTILAPYADDLSVQQKIAGYANKVKALKASAFDQDNTLGIFKQNVSDALYSSGNVIRDPAKMALFSASALDNVVNTLDNAIATQDANGKSTDKLTEYRKQVAQLANGQRDLVNQLNAGTNPQNLDGYGYFVKTNPVDGSLIGAALLPVNSAPDEIKQGTKRIDNNVSVNGSKIPVYLPATVDSEGNFNARLYNNTWSGTSGDPVLNGSNTPNFENKDSFDIRDQTAFPIKKNTLNPGSFGRVVSGVKDNQTQYSYFYRGQDGKVRQLDQTGLDAFKQDPIFAPKVSGYIPLLAPDEIKSLGSIDRLNPSDVGAWSSKIQADNATAQQAAAQKAAQDHANNPFVKGYNAFADTTQKIGDTLAAPLNAAYGAAKGFFSGRKNEQNKPDAAPQGSQTSYNAPDVVDKGKQIFAGGGGDNNLA